MTDVIGRWWCDSGKRVEFDIRMRVVSGHLPAANKVYAVPSMTAR